MESILGQTLSHYRITVRRRTVGAGEDYKAEDERSGHVVTLKLLPERSGKDRSAVERLLHSLRAVTTLTHPHICALHDLGEWNGRVFLVLEAVEGESLRQHVVEHPMRFAEILDIGVQLADALEVAHRAGVIHGGLQPENILITRQGEAKIVDFGLAEQPRPVAGAEEPTKQESETYQSPERARGETVDRRTDLFSLGAILYEMAAGRPAFSDGDGISIRDAILTQTPSPPSSSNPEVPPKFDEIVDKTLEKHIDLRYQAAAELRTDLRRLRRDWESSRVEATRAALVERPAEGVPAEGTEETVGTAQARTRPGRRSWTRIAAALLLAGAVGAVAVRLLRRSESRLPPVFQQLTSQRGRIGSARFGPDGRTILYAAAWEGEAPRIYSVQPGTQLSAPLGQQEAALLAVSSEDESAVLTDIHLSEAGRMEGNLGMMTLSGGVAPGTQGNVVAADWLGGSNGLAVVRRVNGMDRLEYPVGHVLDQTTGWIATPRFSPKGDSIAFVEHPTVADEVGSVDMVSLQGSKKELSQEWSSIEGLAWVPDGSEIWFAAARRGNRQLYAVSLTGKVRQVTAMAGSLRMEDIAPDGRVLLARDDDHSEMMEVTRSLPGTRDLSWHGDSRAVDVSADGKTVLFEENGGAGEADGSVNIRGTDGSAATRLGSGHALALSPDGKWALAESLDPNHQLVLLPTGSGKPVNLPPVAVSHVWAKWLPDGQRFVFLGRQPGQGLQLFIENISGGLPRSISPPGLGAFVALSPDGRYVAAVGPDGQTYLFPIEGGGVPTVRGLAKEDRLVGWGQSGEAVYVAEGTLPVKVYRLYLGSGAKTLLWQLAPGDSAGVSRIGSIQVTPNGQLCVFSYRRRLSTLYLASGLQ